jgi:hypothetical protein
LARFPHILINAARRTQKAIKHQSKDETHHGRRNAREQLSTMNIYKGLAAPLAFYKTSLANHLSHKCKKPIESTVSPLGRWAGRQRAAFCFSAAFSPPPPPQSEYLIRG